MPDVIKGKEHKVKTGESIASLAQENGLKWQDLAKFNWGTDNPNLINIQLKDKVGCRKKTADGHNYVFSDEDDPGIIYIPENAPPKEFPSNGEHVIVVKPPTKKVFKTSKCMVTFRPHAGWKGEFGFDWLRDNYNATLVTGGYSSTSPSGLTVAKAVTNLAAEYDTLRTEIAGNPEYRVPHLNIFHQGTSGNPNFEAKLKLHIVIEEEAAELLELVFPEHKASDGSKSTCFEISPNTPLPTAVGKHDVEITFKCVKEIQAIDEIAVMCHTRNNDGSSKKTVVGRLIVYPNGAGYIKRIKFIRVKVLTDTLDTGAATTGTFNAAEILNLKNSLYQALIIPEIESTIEELNLSKNSDFQKSILPGFVRGKFYIKNHAKGSGLYEDHADFFTTVKELFLSKGTNRTKYQNHFPIFSFGEDAYDGASGQVQGIGIKNLIVFPDRDNCTVNHEVLHGLKLLHSFKSVPVASSAKFTFEEGKTDNVMDYTFDSSALILWRWQWEIAN